LLDAVQKVTKCRSKDKTTPMFVKTKTMFIKTKALFDKSKALFCVFQTFCLSLWLKEYAN